MQKVITGVLGLGLCLALGACSSASEEDVTSADSAFSSVVRQRVTCQSNDYRYNTCYLNTQGGHIESVYVVRQYGGSCTQGQSFGNGPDYVWVDRGCGAEFEVSIRVGGHGGVRTEQIECASSNYQHNECYSSLSNIQSIRLVRPESSAPCVQGQTFGNGDHSIWVDRGCRGVFEVSGYGYPPGPPPPPSGCGTLAAGQGLAQNQHVDSCDGRTMLVHVNNGNVVLFHDGNALWWTGTYDSSSTQFVMQNDGNLVLYNRSGQAEWASNTQGLWGATLSVQDDCNAVIYANGRPVWSTNTYGCYIH